jgi:hypothetical protein
LTFKLDIKKNKYYASRKSYSGSEEWCSFLNWEFHNKSQILVAKTSALHAINIAPFKMKQIGYDLTSTLFRII